MKTFYITTTLPYANAEPHIGHALEFVRADVIARVKKLEGYDVFFNTGMDEHGAKVYRNAISLGMEPQKYVDDLSHKFKELLPMLGMSEDIYFTRTSSPEHKKSAQAFWKLCDKNGFIYKKNYKIKYCVGCELEKTDSELVDGKCSIHPLMNIEEIDEENYFFKFSEFQKPLLNFYDRNPYFVIPDFRYNEIKAFVKRGLQDFSISRLKSKMPWGVEVPDDKDHVMYVWFDAFINYISVIGWPDNKKEFKKWWISAENVVQYCGKDNLRQQTAMWQSMLMAVGLPNSRQVVVNGFITGDGGIKMSKSLGNTASSEDIVNEYGTDALRYYLLREIHQFEDSPFTMEKFKEAYNANLANGLGNLVSRVMKMVVTYGVSISKSDIPYKYYKNKKDNFLSDYNIVKEMDDIWLSIKSLDEAIQKTEPFKKIKTNPEEAKEDLKWALGLLFLIAVRLEPFLPSTSRIIMDLIKENKIPEKPLFLRK